jgi:cupin 2 domain-containing protein
MMNLFHFDETASNQETFQTLLQTKKIQIEKITSYGQHADTWYEQNRDEWVVLIEGEGHLLLENGPEIHLKKGEHIYIPKMQKHKVIFTSADAIWLAIHFD